MAGNKDSVERGRQTQADRAKERLAEAEKANRRTDGPGSEAWARKHGLIDEDDK